MKLDGCLYVRCLGRFLVVDFIGLIESRILGEGGYMGSLFFSNF